MMNDEEIAGAKLIFLSFVVLISSGLLVINNPNNCQHYDFVGAHCTKSRLMLIIGDNRGNTAFGKTHLLLNLGFR